MDAQVKNDFDEILKVDNVTVAFGEFKALDALTFSMARGELRVVIGPNGAGENDAPRRNHRQDATALRPGVVPTSQESSH